MGRHSGDQASGSAWARDPYAYGHQAAEPGTAHGHAAPAYAAHPGHDAWGHPYEAATGAGSAASAGSAGSSGAAAGVYDTATWTATAGAGDGWDDPADLVYEPVRAASPGGMTAEAGGTGAYAATAYEPAAYASSYDSAAYDSAAYDSAAYELSDYGAAAYGAPDHGSGARGHDAHGASAHRAEAAADTGAWGTGAWDTGTAAGTGAWQSGTWDTGGWAAMSSGDHPGHGDPSGHGTSAYPAPGPSAHDRPAHDRPAAGFPAPGSAPGFSAPGFSTPGSTSGFAAAGFPAAGYDARAQSGGQPPRRYADHAAADAEPWHGSGAAASSSFSSGATSHGSASSPRSGFPQGSGSSHRSAFPSGDHVRPEPAGERHGERTDPRAGHADRPRTSGTARDGGDAFDGIDAFDAFHAFDAPGGRDNDTGPSGPSRASDTFDAFDAFDRFDAFDEPEADGDPDVRETGRATGRGTGPETGTTARRGAPDRPGGRAAARRSARAEQRRPRRALAATGGVVVTGAVLAGAFAMNLPGDDGTPQAAADGGAQDLSRDTGQNAASRSNDRGGVQPAAQTPGPAALPVPTPGQGTPTERLALKFPIAPDLALSGKFDVMPGTVRGPANGGRVFTYRVEVERGLDLDGALFADFVQATINDERSWAHGGARTFTRTDGADADFVVRLASPGTTDRLCRMSGLDITETNVSCDSAATDWIVINAWRWAQGSTAYGEDMHGYRQMLINHEVGHRIGNGHNLRCRSDGLAPVMMQQTKSLEASDGRTCRPNPWPYPA